MSDDRPRPIPETFSRAHVERHRGNCGDFLARYELAAARACAAGRRGLAEIAPYLLGWIADTRNLGVAWDYLAEHGGNAPGPDGMRYSDIRAEQVWGYLRDLGDDIRSCEYVVGPDRLCLIPKTSGRGFRRLRILDVMDRVVHRAIVQILQPLIDPRFDALSFGYRPRRYRNHALATVESLALSQRRLAWVAEDIRDAFDHVPLRRLMDILPAYCPAHDVVSLVARAIATGSKRGLRQGSSLSPLLMNIYLDRFLDTRWRRLCPDIPLVRVADDILLLCRSVREAEEAWEALRTVLRPAGMPLKGSPRTCIHDLRTGETAEWLGFAVSAGDDGLEVRISEAAWGKLGARVDLALEGGPDAHSVTSVVQGWVFQMGPCYRDDDLRRTWDRLAALLREHGLDRVVRRRDFLNVARDGHEEWLRVRRKVRRSGCGL